MNPPSPTREHLASQVERRHCSNNSLRSCAAIVFGFHGSRRIYGTGAAAPWRPSCHIDDRLNLSGFKRADVAFNRLIHAVGPLQQCWKARRIRCVLLRRLRGSEQEVAISFSWCLGMGAESWTFPVWWKVGAPSRGTWQPHSPNLEGSSSPNHLFSLNHESRRSVFQMEPRDAGSSWFFMPALTGFTVKGGIFFIKSNFLPYFLLIYRLDQRWNASDCHIHIPERLGIHWNDQSLSRQMFQQPIHCSAVPARLSQFLTRTLEPRIGSAWMRWKKAVIVSQQWSDSEMCIQIKWSRSTAKATLCSINYSQSPRRQKSLRNKRTFPA